MGVWVFWHNGCVAHPVIASTANSIRIFIAISLVAISYYTRFQSRCQGED